MAATTLKPPSIGHQPNPRDRARWLFRGLDLCKSGRGQSRGSDNHLHRAQWLVFGCRTLEELTEIFTVSPLDPRTTSTTFEQSGEGWRIFRSKILGRDWEPVSRRFLNPFVIRSACLWPLHSSRAFVATVVESRIQSDKKSKREHLERSHEGFLFSGNWPQIPN